MNITIAGVGSVRLISYQEVGNEAEFTEAIVLVERAHDYDQYVTWRIGTRPGAHSEAFNGHYYRSLAEAIVDFNARANNSSRIRKAREIVASK